MKKKRKYNKRTSILVMCKGCDLEFHADDYEVGRGGGKFCSRTCSRSFQAKINARNMINGITRKERNDAWKESVRPEVHRAHDMVQIAIKNGTLCRDVCEACGSHRVDAHHDDYSKPLEVRWLCRGHHLEHHRSNKSTPNL